MEAVNSQSDEEREGCCDDNKIKMTRKPVQKQKENLVECVGEGKQGKGNKRREAKEEVYRHHFHQLQCNIYYK